MRGSALALALVACHVPWAFPIEPTHHEDSASSAPTPASPAPAPEVHTLTLRSDCATPVVLEIADQKITIASNATTTASYQTGRIVLDDADGSAIASVDAAATGVIVGPDCRSLTAQ